MRSVVARAILVIAGVATALSGCGSPGTEKTVVIYTSVDEPIARPILEEFTKRTGIAVTIVTDAEASKTTGLAAKLEAEKGNPQADVYWGNEPFYTINLASQGVLASYASPVAATIPPMYKDAQNRWAPAGCVSAYWDWPSLATALQKLQASRRWPI